MSKKVSIIRYHLIINLLRRIPSTFEEILNYLEMQSEVHGFDFSIGIRTFQRDVIDIYDIYKIEIKYDFSRKFYFIKSEFEKEAQERALESFDLFNALNLKEQLSDYIHFEKRKPLGTENVYELLNAIKKHNIIHFQYEKYGDSSVTNRIVEPYALKEDKFRWYLVGKDVQAKDIRIFGLDRLTDLVVKRLTFERPSFDVKKFFQNFFGVDRYQRDEIEKVVLSFTPFQGKYIKSLPLHETQRVLIDDDKEFRVELELYITLDFIMEILSMSDQVEVVEPESLRERMKDKLERTLGKYGVGS